MPHGFASGRFPLYWILCSPIIILSSHTSWSGHSFGFTLNPLFLIHSLLRVLQWLCAELCILDSVKQIHKLILNKWMVSENIKILKWLVFICNRNIGLHCHLDLYLLGMLHCEFWLVLAFKTLFLDLGHSYWKPEIALLFFFKIFCQGEKIYWTKSGNGIFLFFILILSLHTSGAG